LLRDISLFFYFISVRKRSLVVNCKKVYLNE
jgi:hypothetical protein